MSEENMKDHSQDFKFNMPKIQADWKWRHDKLQSELATLRTALAKTEAENVGMRGILNGVEYHARLVDDDKLLKYVREALSSSSGSKLMERMEALEKVVEAARDQTKYHIEIAHELIEALKALDALQSKDTL